jgi:hypothetical protein
MTKAKIAIGTALLAGILAVPLIIQQHALAAARAEQSDLQERLRNLPAQTAQPAPPPAGMIDIAARDRADLARLRLEVPALRSKIAEFSAQAEQLTAAKPWHKPDGKPLGEVLRPRDARDAGQATPEAAMQTFLWAMLQGDTNRISQLIVLDAGGDDPTLQKALEKILEESDDMRRDASAADLDKLEVLFLEEQSATNDDRWVVGESLQEDGNIRGLERILLRPTDTGWRCVVKTNGDPVEEPITDQP